MHAVYMITQVCIINIYFGKDALTIAPLSLKYNKRQLLKDKYYQYHVWYIY